MLCLLEVMAQLCKYFETEGITSNDIIIDSLHNPDLSTIVVGHVTPLQDQEGMLSFKELSC